MSSATTPIGARPDLQISKTDGGVTATPGGVILYTLTYRNQGDQSATGVVIREVVPANTRFNASRSTSGWSCANASPAGTVCTYSVGTLPVGPSRTVVFAVTIDNPLPPGTVQISNTATINDDGRNGPDPTPDNNTSTVVTPAVRTGPDLRISKTDSNATATPGGVIVYTLNYTNVGNSLATGVVITETVPPNTRFKAASSTAGWSCADASPAGVVCTLNVGSLVAGGAGMALFAVTVQSPLPSGVAQIVNTTAIGDDGKHGPDLNPGDNTSTETTSIGGGPDLRIVKNDDGRKPAPGDVITYSLAFTNVGNRGATGVVITEIVPAYSTFFAGASSLGWSCADGSLAGTICTYSVGSLPSGGSGTVAFAVRVLKPLPQGARDIVNTVAIGDDGTNGSDQNPADNSATKTTPIDVPTALTLLSLDAVPTERGIDVRWQTGIELGTSGFHIWRSTDGTRQSATRITTQPLPANGRTAGASYTLNDIDVRPGGAYTYWLEERRLDGTSREYGPVFATITAAVELPQRRYLPLITR